MVAPVLAVQPVDGNRRTIQALGLGTNQILVSGATSAFANASVVRIVPVNSDINIAIGSNALAGTGSPIVLAGTTEYFTVGSNQRIALFGGSTHITIMI